MNMPVEPCQWCAAPTARWCGTRPCCWGCHTERCSTPVSRGRPGRVRRDHGDDQYDLTCVACGATWVGPAWESCDWCQWALEGQRDGQRTLLLMEPDFDPDEDEKDIQRRMEAWAARLVIGIEAGLVTAQDADLAVEQWAKKVNQWLSKS